MALYIWLIRNPDGGATGLEYAKAKMDPHDHVLAHALPTRIEVEVRDEEGVRLAHSKDLMDDRETPIARLRVVDGRVERENIWPSDDEVGLPVILPGGEVGILKSWWHAEDFSAWRWLLELSNKR